MAVQTKGRIVLFRGRAVLVKAKVSSSGESVAEVPLVLLFNMMLMSFNAVLHEYDHFAACLVHYTI